MALTVLCLAPLTASSAAEVRGMEAGGSPAVSEPNDYVLERGDVLSIAVWQNQELTRSVIVLPNGNIIFPLAGAVMAAERSISDLKKEMEDRLRPYVSDLVLTISVEQPRSMVFYIIGRVNRAGEFTLRGNLTILQALAMAGGPNEFARTDSIKLFRKRAVGMEIIDFDYAKVSKGENLTSNILVQRDDTLVIP
jgi:polysaccharide export outer membrane protein